MSLPNSYVMSVSKVDAYFDAILNAEAPDRFSQKFLENLGFSSSNDRLLIGVLKELKFIDENGIPLERYYQFLDRTVSYKVLGVAIKEAYSDLFAVNTNANEMSIEEIKNKLRTLYAGSKKDNLIARIASTFKSLCEIADFSGLEEKTKVEKSKIEEKKNKEAIPVTKVPGENNLTAAIDSLQYHINIVLPASRDEAVYDAIFKAMKTHFK